MSNDIITVVDVIISNKTVVNETALTFETNMETAVDLTMSNLIFYPVINDIHIENTKLTMDKVGMSSDYRYNSLFTQMLD